MNYSLLSSRSFWLQFVLLYPFPLFPLSASVLQLKCSARIYRIYHSETEKIIEEDRPRILASGRSPDMYPFDQHNTDFQDDNDVYINSYNGKFKRK